MCSLMSQHLKQNYDTRKPSIGYDTFVLTAGQPDYHVRNDMSLIVGKQAFCICENKDVDQLCRNCTADQCLYFRYMDGSIPLLPKSEI